jgi:hypothetical protein
MKKVFVSLLCLVALAGCDGKISVDGKEYNTSKHTQEYCYEGVIYLKMVSAGSSWGSVKFFPDGKIATCKGGTE